VKVTVIGYRLRPADGLEPLTPTFSTPESWKNKQQIEASLAAQKERFLDSVKRWPHLGVIDEVRLFDVSRGKGFSFFRVRPQGAAVGGGPVAVRIRNYLLKWHSDSWIERPFEEKPEDVGLLDWWVRREVVKERQRQARMTFIGFDPLTLLRIMAAETSSPENHAPCPPLMYAPEACLDIADVVMPGGRECLTWPHVLLQRRPANKSVTEWEQFVADWPGPGVQAEADCKIAIELAAQYGLR
jgi:hypothetical protein